MSDSPPFVLPASPRPVPPPLPKRRFVGFLLFTSCLFNFLLLVALGIAVLVLSLTSNSTTALREQHVSGNVSEKNKIAIIHIDGVILEGLLSFVEKQIDQAAGDDGVKAVVVRITSPGGSITASDRVYRRLKELRDGNPEKSTKPKPLVVSMGAVAASGGYYVAMPAKTIFAEPTTLTGSIGVYIALPNVHELTDKYGFKMEVMKRGAVKYAGSPFTSLKPEEREMWQELVDHSFVQFKEVVEDARPQLKGKLEEKVIDEKRTVFDNDGKNPAPIQYVRRLADGGVFTAGQAQKFHLIDKLGYQEDAINEAKDLASLGSDYHVFQYEKPFSLIESLLGAKTNSSKEGELSRLAEGLTPRLWYLAPGFDVTGIVSASQR
jgi:protease IV